MVFPDEGRFCLDGNRRWVKYRRGQWNGTALRLMTSFPKGVMVGSSESLRIVEESSMVAQCGQLHGHLQWLFKQGGAAGHKAGLTALFQAVNVLARWPPKRCDLNPRGMARSVAGSSLSRDGLRTEDELFAALQRV
jgi:hypothetical protein